MRLAIDTPERFLDRLMAVERAWALLDRGEPETALAVGGQSAQVIVRAAAMLPVEAARAALERGLALDGAPAALQLALARALWAMGDMEAARDRFRSALLRARPDGALLVELAGLEQACGDGDAAGLMLAAAHALPAREHDAIRAGGDRLRDLGRPDLALLACALAHARANRDPRMFAAYGQLLDARPDFADFRRVADHAPPELRASARHLATFGALSTAPDRVALLPEATAREASPRWVGRAALPALLRVTIAAARPFAWIRLGDGEARFLLPFDTALAGLVPPEDALAEADHIWRNWFGASLAAAPAERVPALAADLRAAASGADLLGLTPHARLAHDHYHFPYCALVERFAASLLPGKRLLTSANHAADLAEDDPWLGSILGGLDWLGMIGPHADLADRLARRLGIGATRPWLVPGETRLGRAGEGSHFPAIFDGVMRDLALPRPGAVVLVAAGLLGKLYTARIRALGGIALDIGAVADAWMGVNSRGSGMDRLMAQALPPA